MAGRSVADFRVRRIRYLERKREQIVRDVAEGDVSQCWRIGDIEAKIQKIKSRGLE